MSEFSGYEKMPDSLKKLKLDSTDFNDFKKLKWVVTEKVHGANFSFIYENQILKFAKRKDYLNWNDDFFGFQLVVNEFEERIVQMFEDLSFKIKASKYIIYGELFGGEYPHKEVVSNNDIQAIQTGVYYSPTINFCAFDIAIQTQESSLKSYLDYETALHFFEKHEIFHAKALLIGKLEEALNFDIRINSIIPKQLNLPDLNKNIIEGIVVKPFNQLDNKSSRVRPIIKIKNPEFDEQKKFHQAKKWNYIPNVTSNTEELTFVLDELRNYVTLNRLDSVTSKIGTINFNDNDRMSEIKTEFLRDVFTDFNENNDHILSELTLEQNNWLKNRIASDIQKIISTLM